MVYEILLTIDLKNVCQELLKQQSRVEQLKEIFNNIPQENADDRNKAMWEYERACQTLRTKEKIFIDETLNICKRALDHKQKGE